MKKLILALSIALSFATVVALQGQASQGAKHDRAVARGDQVTVSGCLERAVRNPPIDTGNEAVGTSGTTAPTIRSDTKWVLTAASKPGSNKQVGTSGGGRSKVDYRLDIGDESTYAAHEGHKVQITGTLEEGQSAAAGEAETKPSQGRHAPLLKVQSVKMLSENCSR